MGTVVALEFCILIWAPEFLERVAGLSRATAAASAAAFAPAVLVGRIATGQLVRRVAAPHIFMAALAITLLGLVVYWGTGQPLAVVAGLFVIGLGVAPLYPLALGFALGAGGTRSDTASARILLAQGVVILLVPALLGGLADEVGLSLAHLIVPALAVTALLCLAGAGSLQGRSLTFAG
jgi:fucose permease